MATSENSSHTLRVSAPVYFLWVALLTLVGVGVAMLLRPTLTDSIRSALGLAQQPQAAAGSFYTVRVAPLFEEHCTACHGAHRQKADLRLDSLAAVMRGSKHGPIIVHRDWKSSELMTRLTLPATNEKAMPPSGKPPLSADEVQVIRLWVAAGASGALPVAAIHGAPPPVLTVEFPKVDEAAVARARAPLAQTVKELQARFPGVLSYESRGSADLQVNASLLGRRFGDREFAAFAGVREHIVWADLSGTSISDASAQALAECKRLRTLRLANTAVADPTARALTSMTALKSLTVVGTALTESSLAALRGRGVRIYGGDETSSDSNATS
jgi:hypothetical protein